MNNKTIAKLLVSLVKEQFRRKKTPLLEGLIRIDTSHQGYLRPIPSLKVQNKEGAGRQTEIRWAASFNKTTRQV